MEAEAMSLTTFVLLGIIIMLIGCLNDVTKEDKS